VSGVGAVLAAATVAACSTTVETTPDRPAGRALTPVTLQLQWSTQAQFAGYYAALDHGYYRDAGLDVSIAEGGVDIVPQTVLAQGQADFAVAWVPKALASREQGAGITDVAQIYQRSGTRQVSFKDKNITTAADLKGKKVGNWGFGNEFELLAGMTKAGLDPGRDVTLVQQQFDMQALLKGDIDAAQAMVYNEYAQALEATDPGTGKLHQAEDFDVLTLDDRAMLQDAVWADTEKLDSDKAYQDTTVKFIQASLEGWAFCRDNPVACRDIVVAQGSKLGASHQLWQMNQVNQLIWPAPAGAGLIDRGAWDQTVQIAETTRNAEGRTVLTKAPEGEAYTNEYVEKALANLKAAGGDTTGITYAPIDVHLRKGGA
jgi:NitT/TauT family transport system substrate-binding protein